MKKQYDRNNKRVANYKGHKAKRMSTVEPVFGILINFLGMTKANTRGIDLADKYMIMAASTFTIPITPMVIGEKNL